MRRKVFNLNFHGIGRPTRDLTQSEAQWWITEAAFGALLDAIEGQVDIALSFDDGNRSDIEKALPALLDHGLVADFHIVAGRIDEPHFLGRGELRDLVSAGMRIGCHGMRHRSWRHLDDPGRREEMVEARDRIEQAIGSPVTIAALPFGAYDRKVLHAAREVGYEHVYTVDGGPAWTDAWLQSRNSIRPGDDPSWVKGLRRRGLPTTQRLKMAVKRLR